MKSILCLLIIGTMANAFAGTYYQTLLPGGQTSYIDNSGNQMIISCQGTPAPAPEPVPVVTEYRCSAECVAGNNTYYNSNVAAYFYQSPHGANRILTEYCQAALPNEVQRNGSRLSNFSCEEVEAQTSGNSECSAKCIAGNNSYYNTDVKTYVENRTDSFRILKSLERACFRALPNDVQRKGSRLLNVTCK